jgi:hypothetical protein
VASRSTILLIASADTEQGLPPVHFSQAKVRVIRGAIEANPQFVRLYTTNAIQGVKFDVYAVSRANGN